MGKRAENAVKVIFTYDVPVDNQKEYLQATGEKIRPFWEAHGCQSYSVWQVTDHPTAFVKEMAFGDLGTLEKSMALQEAKSVKDLFHSFVNNVSCKICIHRV
jgi:hypothetical protein